MYKNIFSSLRLKSLSKCMDLVLLFHVIGTSKVMLEQDTDYLGQGK